MIAWDSTVVGAKAQYYDKLNAWLTNDSANHRIGFLAVPGLGQDAQKGIHNGVHHAAF